MHRNITGKNNNLKHPDWGVLNSPLLRVSGVEYKNGRGTMRTDGPPPREISNLLCQQTKDLPAHTTDMFWLWGQFVDHTLDLTGESEEHADMKTGDGPEEKFPGRTIPFKRSEHFYDCDGVRQMRNKLTAFMDADVVYAADNNRADILRRNDGTGKLKMVAGCNNLSFLPKNTYGLPNANATHLPPDTLFLAGDVRANENCLLTSLHTLLAREHNRLCDIYLSCNPAWFGDDEKVYQKARSYVIGLMQHITYDEFLPKLLGPIPEYKGYDSETNPGICQEFAHAAYRFGHSMVSSNIKFST